MKKTVTFLATLIVAVGAQAACYTVLGPKGKVLSESATPPVDMAYQLHQTVPYAYGQGATMVFGIADPRCGDDLDRYYDLKTAQVVYEAPRKGARKGKKHARKHVRKARRAPAVAAAPAAAVVPAAAVTPAVAVAPAAPVVPASK